MKHFLLLVDATQATPISLTIPPEKTANEILSPNYHRFITSRTRWMKTSHHWMTLFVVGLNPPVRHERMEIKTHGTMHFLLEIKGYFLGIIIRLPVSTAAGVAGYWFPGFNWSDLCSCRCHSCAYSLGKATRAIHPILGIIVFFWWRCGERKFEGHQDD